MDWVETPLPHEISIHAPLAGSDIPGEIYDPDAINISIHAPLAGSDPFHLCEKAARRDFYPRSPRGERPDFTPITTVQLIFLSTLPSRGATAFANMPTAHIPRFLSTLPSRGAT